MEQNEVFVIVIFLFVFSGIIHVRQIGERGVWPPQRDLVLSALDKFARSCASNMVSFLCALAHKFAIID